MDQQSRSGAGSRPFDSRLLEVGDGHSLYLEQSGPPDGRPAVFLHGGPGSGCQAAHRQLFDPGRDRVVLFDQRGAGKSTPRGRLEANTTPHLVADLERIREALNIERWLVVGGSWGSLLGIAYALAHPERVTGLVLRGLFLGSAAEVEWAFVTGPQTLRPELWRAFLAPLPESERDDPLAAYGRRLRGQDRVARRGAARIWHAYEQALSQLQPASTALPGSFEEAARQGSFEPLSPAFEWHYMCNGFFLGGESLLERAAALGELPGIVVQGRYDLICPPLTARALAARWPACRLRMVEAAGHALTETELQRAVGDAIGALNGA